MLPKKVKKRASLLTIFLSISVISVFIILNALNENILYFNSPSDIKSNPDINFDKKIRVGGMVKKNTLKISDQEIRFIITDFKNEIRVSFKGTVPNLFAEGKGVVAEGKLQDKKFFVAERILAKHDENYMPPELKNLVKENAK
ncbi:MAG: cytochrome c maturation protein CcmE [Pseudomonadota bacterium]|nr:cytochrome c maturation protein CcmE [Pseudomonadota bacterium]